MFSRYLDKQAKSGCSLDSIVISSYRKKCFELLEMAFLQKPQGLFLLIISICDLVA